MHDKNLFDVKENNEAYAICPLDGRYSQIGKKLTPYFSEYALVKYRVIVEIKWLLFLIKNINSSNVLKKISEDRLNDIMKISNNFSFESYKRIKEIEAITNHDVKAVELFVAEKLKEIQCESLMSFVHIGCTSEDISNCAYATMIKKALEEVWIPTAENLVKKISDMANEYSNVSMLAHTHGQAATPTTVGKELAVFVYRMRKTLSNIKNIHILSKFNGATGNYAAISVVFPVENWPMLSKKFVEEELELEFNPVTTQIESHDYICEIADGIRHFNNILLDLDLDMWLYISMEYFKQIPIKAEVGSSTMPHKVNPIRFENSEANINMSNAILLAISNKLPCSRMQRDLSDSSTQRNIGMGVGYSLQAIEQTLGGLNKVTINEIKISSELENKWEVLAEPIQTMLRKYGVSDAYDKLKELTRGKNISKEIIHEFINSLDMLSTEDKETLLTLTPSSYFGKAIQIVKENI